MTRQTATRATLILAAGGLCAALAAGPATPPAGAAAAGDAARARAESEVRAFTEACNKAYEKNDLKAYWGCYADDMTQFYEKGRLDLPDYKKLWEKTIADGGAMQEVKIADLVIHVAPADDAAVALYRIFTKMKNPDGSITESWNQESDVLFKRGGKWAIVHLHYAAAPKEG
jgi:ketosteroid isomerase-like protein